MDVDINLIVSLVCEFLIFCIFILLYFYNKKINKWSCQNSIIHKYTILNYDTEIYIVILIFLLSNIICNIIYIFTAYNLFLVEFIDWYKYFLLIFPSLLLIQRWTKKQCIFSFIKSIIWSFIIPLTCHTLMLFNINTDIIRNILIILKIVNYLLIILLYTFIYTNITVQSKIIYYNVYCIFLMFIDFIYILSNISYINVVNSVFYIFIPIILNINYIIYNKKLRQYFQINFNKYIEYPIIDNNEYRDNEITKIELENINSLFLMLVQSYIYHNNYLLDLYGFTIINDKYYLVVKKYLYKLSDFLKEFRKLDINIIYFYDIARSIQYIHSIDSNKVLENLNINNFVFCNDSIIKILKLELIDSSQNNSIRELGMLFWEMIRNEMTNYTWSFYNKTKIIELKKELIGMSFLESIEKLTSRHPDIDNLNINSKFKLLFKFMFNTIDPPSIHEIVNDLEIIKTEILRNLINTIILKKKFIGYDLLNYLINTKIVTLESEALRICNLLLEERFLIQTKQIKSSESESSRLSIESNYCDTINPFSLYATYKFNKELDLNINREYSIIEFRPSFEF